jgi:hypothetical protein
MARLTYTTLVLLFILTSTYGQTKVGAFGEAIKEQPAPILEVSTISRENIAQGANNAADKEKGKTTENLKTNNSEYRYMSYKIQVTVTKAPLDLNHHIFLLYKDITFNQTKAEGFIYFQGDYSDEEQAKLVLTKIQRIFPQATIVKEPRYLKTN